MNVNKLRMVVKVVVKFIEFFSNLAMPLMIIFIVLYGVIERKKVFDIFLDAISLRKMAVNKPIGTPIKRLANVATIDESMT